MKECTIATICNILLISSRLPWVCQSDGRVEIKGKIRRRTRYIPKIADRHERFYLISQDSFLTSDQEKFFRGISFSMPDALTKFPAKPSAREDRDLLIQNKCGVTAIERSRDILTELLTVSHSSTLINPETSQFKARKWLDEVDPAIICPQNKERIDQRYRLALLYFELGGGSWTRCKALQDVSDSDNEEGCPGTRFLDKTNECEWYGMSCGDNYNDITADWLDAYYPLEVLDLQSNNLVGQLYDEFYDFRNLKEIYLNSNNLSGTINEVIENFEGLKILRLESNKFDGFVPEIGLLTMLQLEELSIHGNNIQGSLQALCDVRDERRLQYFSYLAQMIEADCLGKPPKVLCSCCKCF